MFRALGLVDPLEAILEGPRPDVVRVALAVPSSGVLGLTGPAAIAASILAVEEVNAGGGLGGKALELVRFDAGRSSPLVRSEMAALLEAGAIRAVCGFHTSDVRRALEPVVSGQVPYVFTPPHEGGAARRGVALIGAQPVDQLLPVAAHLVTGLGLTRWAHIGNDYVWPRRVAPIARQVLESHGARIAVSEAVPIGQVEGLVDLLLGRLRTERIEAVLLTLVGRDLAVFNRAFRDSPALRHVVRVGLALDETGLLEVDGDETGELYAAMPWFAGSPASADLQERYLRRWGADAPELGAYAAGCYDGIRLLAELGSKGLLTVDRLDEGVGRFSAAPRCELARADGLGFVPAV